MNPRVLEMISYIHPPLYIHIHTYIYIYIYIYLYVCMYVYLCVINNDVLIALFFISHSLSCDPSVLSIAFDKFSRKMFVSRPTLAFSYIGIRKWMSLVTPFSILPGNSACNFKLTRMICEMRSKWQNNCFDRCWFHDLFKTAFLCGSFYLALSPFVSLEPWCCILTLWGISLFWRSVFQSQNFLSKD